MVQILVNTYGRLQLLLTRGVPPRGVIAPASPGQVLHLLQFSLEVTTSVTQVVHLDTQAIASMLMIHYGMEQAVEQLLPVVP